MSVASTHECHLCTTWNQCKHFEGHDPQQVRPDCEHADFHTCHGLDDDGHWTVTWDDGRYSGHRRASEGQHCPECGTQLLRPKISKPAQMTPREYAERRRTIRHEVLTRDAHTCQVCGKNDVDGLHHVLPRAKNGHDVADNLICTCRWCENAIHGEDLPGQPYTNGNFAMSRAQFHNVCLLREMALLGRTSREETFVEDYMKRRCVPKADPSPAGRRLGIIFDLYLKEPWTQERVIRFDHLDCDVTIRMRSPVAEQPQLTLEELEDDDD